MKSFMYKIAPALSILSLLLILIPAIPYFIQTAGFDNYLMFAQIGTVLWFCVSPFWLIKGGGKV